MRLGVAGAGKVACAVAAEAAALGLLWVLWVLWVIWVLWVLWDDCGCDGSGWVGVPIVVCRVMKVVVLIRR
jgi:hypothetical protein